MKLVDSPTKQKKQMAVGIETLVRKAYSLKTLTTKYKTDWSPNDDFYITTTQNCNKKRASHPSSIRELDIDFRKLKVKIEDAEITMKFIY